jgi:dihydrofolate reductase
MNIIVAVDRKWAIGRDGQLLFTIPDDMRFFKKMTTGKVVVMGHATLRSLPKGKPLKDRVNIVLSRNTELVIEGALVCHSPEELFSALEPYKDDDVWVIGGESVYRLLLPYCTDAYVTKVDAVAAADTFFPNLDESGDWQAADRSETFLHEGLSYAFVHYRCREPLKALQRPRQGSPLSDN